MTLAKAEAIGVLVEFILTCNEAIVGEWGTPFKTDVVTITGSRPMSGRRMIKHEVDGVFFDALDALAELLRHTHHQSAGERCVGCELGAEPHCHLCATCGRPYTRQTL